MGVRVGRPQHDPVVVITAAPGENFGEPGPLGHRVTVNEPSANVPSGIEGSELHGKDMTVLISPDIIQRWSENDTELSRICADGSEVGLSDSDLFPEYEAQYRDWVTVFGPPITIDEVGAEPVTDEHIQKHVREMGSLVE